MMSVGLPLELVLCYNEHIGNLDLSLNKRVSFYESYHTWILAFLQAMDSFCKEQNLSLKIYIISNNVFIEGKQNAPLFYVMENFCVRSDIHWCGGIGIGGGVMFKALRIVFVIEMAIFLLNVFISGVLYGNWIPLGAMYHLIVTLLIITFFHLGVFFICLK